jgi:low affinity Fe/Cu permease
MCQKRVVKIMRIQENNRSIYQYIEQHVGKIEFLGNCAAFVAIGAGAVSQVALALFFLAMAMIFFKSALFIQNGRHEKIEEIVRQRNIRDAANLKIAQQNLTELEDLRRKVEENETLLKGSQKDADLQENT